MLRNCLVIFLLAVCSVGSFAFEGRVIGILDGDTIAVLNEDGQSQTRCRLAQIDAPEKRQDFGQAAKKELSSIIFGKSITVVVTGKDQYERAICKISLGSLDVNLLMVQRGMAWVYQKYNNDSNYSSAEAVAKARKIGLWIDPKPVAPWEFRRETKVSTLSTR